MRDGDRDEEKVNTPGEKAYSDPVEALTTRLMTATKRGDAEAFGELTKTLRGRAYSVAQSLVGSRDDAMELTQEAFLKTYRARAAYRDGEPFLPWFHRILRNTCFSFLRKHKRIRVHSLSGQRNDEETEWELEGSQPEPSHEIERAEAVDVFYQAFLRATARDPEIHSLRHFQDLSYREIAHALDVPEGTVMSRLFHARRRLRDLLAPHLDDTLEDYATQKPPKLSASKEPVSGKEREA